MAPELRPALRRNPPLPIEHEWARRFVAALFRRMAAALIQRLRDSDGPQPIAQWLFGHRVWNNRLNRFGWQSYLGTAPGAANLPPYAAAARREDLSGLPPAWIGV
ncbi:hypothetical protein AB0M80_39330 [Amycolatopsis sp. NPDC051045]|uniref:hypothetical protein n=1 Tax=Amycolatopsis sp. NPDC051045 TaxID=3156922 RepID=UPI003427409A